MSNEQDAGTGPEPDPGEESGINNYMSLGIVFTMLGVVFFLTMDNGLLGLPFFVLGIVFFSSGIAGTRGKDAGSEGT